MSCPTPEQLASISLGLADDARLIEHAETCEACAGVLAAQCEAVSNLSAIHRDLAAQHAASHVQLLERLPAAMDRHSPSAWQRWAIGGFAAAAVILLSFIALAPSRLSAMERIEQAVGQISSLSCKLTNASEFPATENRPARTHRDERFIYWRAPNASHLFGDLHATTTITSISHRSNGDEPPRRLVDLIEIHPSGQPGILIDNLARKYYRIPALHADDIRDCPPLLWLQAVRERGGRVVKNLGSREINGRLTHGVLMAFDNRPEFKNYNPVEVWLDPQTDLPVEFRFQYGQGAEEGFTDEYTVTNIQWNHDLGPSRFDTAPPASFIDVTIPQDDKSIARVVDALRLYAELSGGRYPQVKPTSDRNYPMSFDAEACYREMLDLADSGDSSPDSRRDEQALQRMQQSRAGLATLQQVLANPKWRVGYYADSVRAQDKEKLLLWWNISRNASGDRYRLFYGDLRTEVVSGEEWAKLVPPEIAELAE